MSQIIANCGTGGSSKGRTTLVSALVFTTCVLELKFCDWPKCTNIQSFAVVYQNEPGRTECFGSIPNIVASLVFTALGHHHFFECTDSAHL